jgi:hypothetical protein
MTTGFFNRTIATVALAAIFTQQSSALAAPLKVVKATPEPGIQAKIQTEVLGPIKIPQGSVKFSGSNVTVGAVPDWLFDRHVVLTGKLIDHKISTVEGKSSVQGVIYFLGGDWLSSFPDSKRPDNLELADGTVLVGKVRAVTNDNIDFQVQTGQTRRVKVSEIKNVLSPRAIVFNIPTTDVKVDPTTGDIDGNASDGTFNPTFTSNRRKLFAKHDANVVEPKSVLAGAEGGVTKGQLTTMIMLDVVNTLAPAIVAPIVAPLGSRGAVNKLRETGIQDQLKEASGAFVPSN